MSELTSARLRDVLDYEPETGLFRWKISTSNRVRVGAVAGTKMTKGYRAIGIDGELFCGHFLAWLYVHGVAPAIEIDHKNLDKSDNRISNLREATRAQNAQNQKIRKNNKSGFKGVFRGANKWIAQIRSGDQKLHLGSFDTPEAAHAAYCAAAAKFHGEFAHTGVVP